MVSKHRVIKVFFNRLTACPENVELNMLRGILSGINKLIETPAGSTAKKQIQIKPLRVYIYAK